MPLMNRKVDYALLILSHLHRQPQGGCAREIAERLGLSRAFAANILKELCQKGFVTSQRGVHGGYALRRPPEETNLAELLAALDDSFSLAECCQPDQGEELCAFLALCPVKAAIADVHRRVFEVLRKVTLAELFRPAPACCEDGNRVALQVVE